MCVALVVMGEYSNGDSITCRTQQSLELVCEDCKNKVLDCYRSNPGRPLNCSTEAKEYAECIERARKVRGRQSLW